MRWNKLIEGRDPGGLDFAQMCETFHGVTGDDFKWERHGKMVALYTTGDPEVILPFIVAVSIALSEIENIKETGGVERYLHAREN